MQKLFSSSSHTSSDAFSKVKGIVCKCIRKKENEEFIE